MGLRTNVLNPVPGLRRQGTSGAVATLSDVKRIQLKRPTGVALPASSGMQGLNAREQKFVAEYLVDFNQTRAAHAAGWSERFSSMQGSWLVRQPHIMAEIQRQLVSNRKKLQLSREDLMQFWYDLAYADPRELIPVMVRCCRHCWGEEHDYQFTAIELRELYRQHRAKHKASRNPPNMDTRGGEGFDQKRLPFSIANGQDHDCPQCYGLGVQIAEPLDLTKLSRGANLLIQGIKIGRYGEVEVKFADRGQAVQKLAEYLGYIKPRRGLWDFDFDQLTMDQIDALLREARTRGFLEDSEMVNVIENDPQQQSLPAPSEDEERVS